VSQTNATYNKGWDSRYNISKCNLRIAATKRSACTISWPTEDTPLGQPFNWYELRTNTDLKSFKWNWGTIASISAELFKSLAIAVYCESTAASLILFDGNTSKSDKAIAVDVASAEMKAIVSAMMNRMGNSKKGNYKFNTVVTDVSEQFGTIDFTFPSGEPYKKEVSDDQYLKDEWDSFICQKLRLSIEAGRSVLANGVTVPYDMYVAKGSETLSSSSYERIGNTMFNKKIAYFDCRTKPKNWDTLPVHPDSPRQAD